MILVWSSPLTVTMPAYRYRVEGGRIVEVPAPIEGGPPMGAGLPAPGCGGAAGARL